MSKPTRIRPAYQRMLEDAARRRARALKLHDAGKSVTEVAAVLEVSKQRASVMIKRARAERTPA